MLLASVRWHSVARSPGNGAELLSYGVRCGLAPGRGATIAELFESWGSLDGELGLGPASDLVNGFRGLALAKSGVTRTDLIV